MLDFILLGLALVVFAIAAFIQRPAPPQRFTTLHVIAAGLALWVAVFVIEAAKALD